METLKEANKFSFGLGVFLLFSYGLSIIISGLDIKATIFLLLGIYNIWQHGFVNDTSKWKVKPRAILAISVFIFLLVSGFLFFNTRNKSIAAKAMIEEVVRLSNQELPNAVGENGDSIISVSALNENTLQYLYKMNLLVSDLDSTSLKSFESETREILMGNLERLDPNILKEYRKNKIIFRHNYLDLVGNPISLIEINPSDL